MEGLTEKKSNTKSKHGRKTKLKDSNLVLRNNVKLGQAEKSVQLNSRSRLKESEKVDVQYRQYKNSYWYFNKL